MKYRRLIVPSLFITLIMMVIGFSDDIIPFGLESLPTLPASSVRSIDYDTSEQEFWSVILVNKWNFIPDDYKVELTELTNGQSVDSRIKKALLDMLDAAESEGVYPVVVSGYRSEESQQSLMDDKISEYRAEGYSAEEAETTAASWVAIPGTSEHQIGIAVDINADGVNSAGYEVYKWLQNNSYKFGFIRRYPPDKEHITGVINEPWHYRYVGICVATEMYRHGICLEEYLSRIKKENLK